MGERGTMMNRALIRDTLRCWLHAWKRFASIALISLLGVAVLTGIYAGCRDTLLAADRFYDGQRLMDVQVLSTLGLTDDDVAALRQVEGVAAVQPERTQDVTVSVDGSEKDATIVELGAEGINRPQLDAGRMPQRAGEIAVTAKFLKDSGLAIGDRLTVAAADDDAADDDADTSDDGVNADDGTGNADDTSDAAESAPSFPTDLVIVGTVLDPTDLSNPYGYAGNNFRTTATSDYRFFAPSDGVTGTVYTSISLTVDGAAALDTFSDRYDAAVRAVRDRIERTVQSERQEARRQGLVGAAQRRLDDARDDATTQFADADRQIEQQQSELDANRQTLADSRTQTQDAQRELKDGERQLEDGRRQIADARTQIADGRRQLDDAQAQLDAGARQLADARTQLDAGISQVASARTQTQDGITQLDRSIAAAGQLRARIVALSESTGDAGPGALDVATWRPVAEALAQLGVDAPQDPAQLDSFDPILAELDATSTQLNAQRTQLAAALAAIERQEAELRDKDTQLTAQEQQSRDAAATLQTQRDTLQAQSDELERQSATLDAKAAQLKDARSQLEDGLRRIADGEARLADGQRQLDDARAELAGRRADADAEFARQQQRIDDIAQARWYVQTRADIGGYNALDADISSIESIGRAFPVVFLLVAALMTFTAMTRMVEEDRGLIGTYMGLGYGSAAIAMRYVLFALLACLLGGGAGLLVGFLGIPAFLRIVIGEMYVVPDVRLEYDWTVGSLGVLLFVAGAMIATAVACRGEMRQTPAALMRPKAPRAGARILLERIRPLWRRMGFLNKVAARNIVRFKSRLVMTVLGVAGCTALIVCGLAINDTINALGPAQYGELYRYDLLAVSSDAKAGAMRQRIADDGRAAETLDARIENGEIAPGGGAGGSNAIQLVVVPQTDLARLGDMVALDAPLTDAGVIVERSAVGSLDIRAGGAVTLTDGAHRRAQTTVATVTRNLIGSNVYISESLYRSLFEDASSGATSGASSDASADASADPAPITWNAVYATLRGDADGHIAYADALADDPAVLKTMSSDHLRRSFRFDLMGAVVALITLLAGLLALVVLFTLASTNVSERVREMATLKVLGFFDREVHLYVNKEMTVLTLLGIVVGLPLGRFVGGLLTAALAMPGLYFAVSVHPVSYVIAAAATLAFSLLVQLLTNPVLDRIDPVTSLKSVE